MAGEPAIELLEWQRARPSDGDHRARALAGFRFDNADDRALARQLTEEGKLELLEMHDGLHIRARAHVGRIQIGHLTITVQPKIGTDELLTLFRYALGLRHATRYDAVAYATTGALFADLIIAQLVAEARDIAERGVTRAYVRRQDDLSALRGRIAFAELARRGGVRGAALPCEHHPRSSNHLLNQVVTAGLALATTMASDRRLRATAARHHARYAELAPACALSTRLLDRASRSINRLTDNYSSIIQLIAILQAGTLLTLDARARAQPLPGFLFDMNRFWQRVLDRFLRENLSSLHVESEHGLASMMRYASGHNPQGRRSPTPRPDYAIREGKRVVSLLDAKYRDLWERSLPRDMLYQLAVYALSQPRGATAAILFPTTTASAKPSRIEIRDPVARTPSAYVALRPVELSRLVALIEERGQKAREARSDLARQLALGA